MTTLSKLICRVILPRMVTHEFRFAQAAVGREANALPWEAEEAA